MTLYKLDYDNIDIIKACSSNRIKYIKVYQFCMVIMLLSAGYMNYANS